MKNVVVINAYGDKNIGDAAILHVALKFIRIAYDNKCKISVLCENTNSISNFIGNNKSISSLQLPYGYAIRSVHRKASVPKKIFRFFSIFINTYLIIYLEKFLKIRLTREGFYRYISEIKKADIVIGMGGGYFTTNYRKDYFGLLLSLLPVYIARLYKKTIIFLPISLGPFATKNQEIITYNALRDSTVLARDTITLQQLKNIDIDNRIRTLYAPDLALFFGDKQFSMSKKLNSHYIVMTAREWLPKNLQLLYEDALLSLIKYVWQRYKLKTIFVPMARNVIEDDDNIVANRLLSNLNDRGILKIIDLKSLRDFQTLLGNARIAVCTRMHSAIFSTTVSTPFIAIGYGHKTLGFTKTYNLEKWHIDIKDVDYKKIKTLVDKLLIRNNYSKFISKIVKKQSEIKKYESVIINELINN